MLNLFIRCFSKKYFQFKGRASRKEYLSFLIFNSLLLFLMGVLINISSSNIFIITLAGVYKLISIFPSISVTVRRVHDLNLSAWWCIILIVLFSMLIPFIKISANIIALCALIILGISIVILSLFVIFKKGTDGVNDYGQPPEY